MDIRTQITREHYTRMYFRDFAHEVYFLCAEQLPEHVSEALWYADCLSDDEFDSLLAWFPQRLQSRFRYYHDELKRQSNHK